MYCFITMLLEDDNNILLSENWRNIDFLNFLIKIKLSLRKEDIVTNSSIQRLSVMKAFRAPSPIPPIRIPFSHYHHSLPS
mmetsp:Transcript_17020/g.25764  ORF Transcript_17020/g.25764 Transcript_17020/m.25764 type:complete len:80 (-) Transcript_17020:1135-1374(-)